MASSTENHAYNKPTPGGDEDVWGELLNSNFDDLDVDVVLKGTKANRPDDPPEDTHYLATDEPSFYYYDGTNWNQLHASDYVAKAGDKMAGDLSMDGSHFLDAVKGLNLSDAGADPANNGEQRLNGNDLKVYSGGQVRNLSNVGSSGSGDFNQTTQTADYSSTDGDSVWVDTSSNNVTVTLPTPSQGARIRVKHYKDGGTSNVCDVSPNGTENIDESSSNWEVSLDNSYEFESDGTNWQVF